MLGTWEIVGIVVVIALIIFAGKNSSKIARNVGKNVGEIQVGLANSSKEFVAGLKESKSAVEDATKEIKE
jgi:Sec-independent protein translocase protein TatA